MDLKATYVRALFSGVPKEYDRLLQILTFGQDARWRRLAIEAAAPPEGGRVLDLATGTGVFAFDWVDRMPVSVTALDLTPAMLRHAATQCTEQGCTSLELVNGRTESLPFPDRAFDAVSIGLALRNLTDLEASFSEMARVLKPGGRMVSVDFTRPSLSVFRHIYYLYLCHGLPAVGRTVSQEWEATFEWLWRSILRFYDVETVVDLIRRAGFRRVTIRSLTGGIATMIVGHIS